MAGCRHPLQEPGRGKAKGQNQHLAKVPPRRGILAAGRPFGPARSTNRRPVPSRTEFAGRRRLGACHESSDHGRRVATRAESSVAEPILGSDLGALARFGRLAAGPAFARVGRLVATDSGAAGIDRRLGARIEPIIRGLATGADATGVGGGLAARGIRLPPGLREASGRAARPEGAGTGTLGRSSALAVGGPLGRGRGGSGTSPHGGMGRNRNDRVSALLDPDHISTSRFAAVGSRMPPMRSEGPAVEVSAATGRTSILPRSVPRISLARA